MKRKITSIILFCVLWQMASMHLANDAILPSITKVMSRLYDFACDSDFYIAIGVTLLRVIFSFSIAFISGSLLGIISSLYKPLEEYLYVLLGFIQTVPQIIYILILLVWFKGEVAIFWIIFLMVFPIFYNSAFTGMKNIDSSLQDVITLYHHSFSFNLTKVYLPLIKGYLGSAFMSSLLISFKVGIMAEVFVQTTVGIGRAIYYCRTTIYMAGIFAWMFVIVFLLFVLYECLNKIKKIISL